MNNTDRPELRDLLFPMFGSETEREGLIFTSLDPDSGVTGVKPQNIPPT